MEMIYPIKINGPKGRDSFIVFFRNSSRNTAAKKQATMPKNRVPPTVYTPPVSASAQSSLISPVPIPFPVSSAATVIHAATRTVAVRLLTR